MEITLDKLIGLSSNLEEENLESIIGIFPLNFGMLNDGFKYLGYFLKPNYYRVANWFYILRKVEKHINFWCNRWLSLRSQLILAKSVIKRIPVFWVTLSKFFKIILVFIMKLSAWLLWNDKNKKRDLRVVK